MSYRLLALALFVLPPSFSTAEEAAAAAQQTGIDAEESGDGEPEGGLAREVISSVIGSRSEEIGDCYNQRLAEKPQLAGRIGFFWTIDGDGAPTLTAIQDEIGDAALVECISEVIWRMRFPPPRGGGDVRVAYPWVFQRPGHPSGTAVWVVSLQPERLAPWPPEVTTARVEVLADQRDAVTGCLDEHDGEDLTDGFWRGASLEIGRDGEVSAELVGVPSDTELGACLLGVLNALRFPPSPFGTTTRGSIAFWALRHNPRYLEYQVARWVALDLLDRASLMGLVDAHTPWAQLCYLERRRDAVNVGEVVRVAFEVDSAGAVSTVEVTESGEGAAVEDCIAGVVRNMSFPAPAGGSSVLATYSWGLHDPGNSDTTEASRAPALAAAIAESRAVDRCRRRHYLSREPAGELDLGVVVAPDGRVMHSAILGGEPSPRFEACLLEAVTGLRLPALEGDRLIRVDHHLKPEVPSEIDRFSIRTTRRAPDAWGLTPFGAPSIEGTVAAGAVPHTGHPVPEKIVGWSAYGRLALRFRMLADAEGEADVLYGPSEANLLALSVGMRGRVLRGGRLLPALALAGGLSVTGQDLVTGARLALTVSWLTAGPLAIHAQVGGLIWHRVRENLVLQPALGATWSIGKTTSVHAEGFAVVWTLGGTEVHRGVGVAFGIEQRLSASIVLALSGDLYDGPDGIAAAARLSAGWRRNR